ncbi:hypothetical protein NDI45_08925 [Leptolyngbya sp. GB1-A1]|uniref:hypothetical protein n=1 Tax=Leptolyngbya sp. GB1-A1 TaxID=2933908 RepID=UPI003296C67F
MAELEKIENQVQTPYNYPSEADYIQILERFALYSERGWKGNYLGDPQLGYFGDPDNDESGMRSMGNYIFTTSLLASDPAYNPNISGIEQSVLLDRAKCCLNYMTRSHVTGDIPCGNGRQWGNAWQSAWWTTKMALGAQLIWHTLSQEQQRAVERVVVFEASRHLDRIVPSGLAEDTKAEENAWDTEILATAIALFPQHQQCEGWREKLIEFSLNTLSVAQDHHSQVWVDGKQLKEQVYTVNIYSDYTLENHGAYHFCYVASPLVSVTWSYYALLSTGQPIPEALFHHVKDLWNRVKTTFLDNRFAYIGGKDWARYTYGLYFIVPVLVLLQNKYEDTDARTIEVSRICTLASEQQDNQDGSFFGQRVTRNRLFGQSAKYETDCYADLGLAYLLHRRLQTTKQITPPQEFAQRISGRTMGQEASICWVRTPELFASFSWRTLTDPFPIALFIPSGMDNAAEWTANNLLGRVTVLGIQSAVSIRSMQATGDGFIVKGTISYRSRQREAFVHELSYEVRPGQKLAIVESRFIARSKIMVIAQEGLRLAIANDRFNDYERHFKWDTGSATISFDPTTQAQNHQNQLKSGLLARLQRKAVKLLNLRVVNWQMGQNWVNVDDKLGIVQLHNYQHQTQCEWFNLRQELDRNTPNSCLHYDILNYPRPTLRPQIRQSNEVLLHTKFLVVAGTAAETEGIAHSSSIDRVRID